MYKKRSSGFTLVEIAIVMVIIGLLLGGALKGQQMIENARYKALKSEVKEIQAALYSFIDIYGSLPGDIPDDRLSTLLVDATPAQIGTQGDGRVTLGFCNNGNEESCMVFHHLRQAGLLNGDATAVGIASQFDTSAGGFFNGISSGWLGNDNDLVLIMQAIPGEVAQRLDTELDDGDGRTGSIICPGCTWANDQLRDVLLEL